jgi:aminoglycoside phosphotransferase (APT) family kinase protein
VSEVRDVEGIAYDSVVEWFVAHVDGTTPPLAFELVAGGRSNLTYKVTDDAGHAWVLRRPPLGHILATAHDMSREFRIISALGPTPVPVPPAIGFCDDDAVNERPFYVMGFVDGHILRDAATATRVLDEAGRRHAGEALVDVMAAIHAVDPDAVGLGDLGRKEGYIERQLRRWHKQWEQSKTREVPLVDELYERLLKTVPEQGPATIVHGDYRLDNTLIGPDGDVKAVLDWELCTLGDPLADVGLLMVYWAQPGDEHAALVSAPTLVAGFPSRDDVRERYAAASGRDVSALEYYVAFGYWKLACILEGVYARYAGGAMAKDGAAFESFAQQVVRLAETAAAAADRVP